MDVYVGKTKHLLGKGDFVAAGGEGAVYRKAGKAFKVYSSQQKMIPVDKIRELSALSLPEVVKPEDVLLDKNGTPIGYTMRFLDGTHPLCQLFTKSFKDRNNVTRDMVLGIVKKMKSAVDHCHDKDVLIVDLNEMNVLVDSAFQEAYLIDVDSYQTKSFPATAIMDSIRDRHAKAFSEGTDWFSFAVLTFQMQVGIHPYKGTHPTIKGWDERMLANVSVLNKDVKVPSVCPPFSVIPDAYKAWYVAVFEKGERIPPPSDLHATAVVAAKVRISGSDNFIIRRIAGFPSMVARAVLNGEANGLLIGFLSDGRVFEGSRAIGTGTLVAWGNGACLIGSLASKRLSLLDVHAGRRIEFPLDVDEAMDFDGTIYARSYNQIMELEIVRAHGGVIVGQRLAGTVLESAAKMYDGVVVSSLLGACYLSIFPKKGSCHQVHVKEMDGYRVVSARFCAFAGGGVVMAVGFKDSKYDKFVLRFDESFSDHDCRILKDVDASSDVNFVVLPSGVCVNLNDKDELELFRARKGEAGMKVYSDDSISGDMRLLRDGPRLAFSRDDEVFSIEIKKGK